VNTSELNIKLKGAYVKNPATNLVAFLIERSSLVKEGIIIFMVKYWVYISLNSRRILVGRNYVSVIVYIFVLILVGYLSIQSLIYSVMKPSFPNFQFILTFILMIAISWIVGLSVKRYIDKTANRNRKIETNLKMFFVSGTVIALICLFGLFMLT
jgi:hypothetical protein